jgi:hypothetical protein
MYYTYERMYVQRHVKSRDVIAKCSSTYVTAYFIVDEG